MQTDFVNSNKYKISNCSLPKTKKGNGEQISKWVTESRGKCCNKKIKAWHDLLVEYLEYLVQIPWKAIFSTEWQTPSPKANPVAGDYEEKILEIGRGVHTPCSPLPDRLHTSVKAVFQQTCRHLK